MKKAPILYLLIPFITGIILCELWPIISARDSAIIGCATLLASAIVLFPSKKHHYLSICFFLSGTLALGYCNLEIHQPEFNTQHYVHHLQNEGSDEKTLAILCLKEPSYKKGKTNRALAEVIAIAQNPNSTDRGWIKTEGKIQLFFPLDDSIASSLHRGDTLVGNIRFQIPRKFSEDFNYPAYLRHKGILRTSYITSNYYTVIHNQRHSILSQIDQFRLTIMEQIRQQDLSPTQQHIANAMLLGRNSYIDQDTQQQFREAGITHLLCVSGLHVGIIAFLIEGLLYFLRRGPRYRVLIGALQLMGIWFFVFLTGMAPSTLRAGIMFSFIIVGRMLWTQSPNIAAIAFSATFLLIITPTLIFDVGFQLSYSAVIGITLLYRPLANLINFDSQSQPNVEANPQPPKNTTSKNRFIKGLLKLIESIWKLLCLSFTAQLATLPFVLYYFHEFPTYFLISNLLVVPLATFILATTLLTVSLWWWPWAASVSCKALKMALWWVESVTQRVSSWPHSTLRVNGFNIIDAILAGAAIVVLGLIIHSLSKKEDAPIKN